jgi:membrane protease YdiL (CAAX protease family)
MGAVVLGRLTEVPRSRLVAWVALVLALAAISYAANQLGGADEDVVAATNTTPIEVTTSGDHGFTTGDTVVVEDVEGNTAANGSWTVTVRSDTMLVLDGSEGSGAYAGGGTVAPGDLLYRWSTVIGGLVQYALILGLVLLIARGLAPAVLGLRAPPSWRAAAGWIAASILAIWVVGAALNPFLEAGEEQGLVPDDWDPDRAGAFVANFVVVALVAPVVEELTYRGLGFAAVRQFFGGAAAVVVTGVAFGLAHGLVIALPVLTIFGLILGWLRLRTESLYPPIILHAVFNGTALLAAVLA